MGPIRCLGIKLKHFGFMCALLYIHMLIEKPKIILWIC